MNKISIITINRNNAKGLKKTIQSIVKQTYKNIEYIVIDGASTDESVDIIKQNESEISYWISESDTGVFNAMNKGIEQASGDYCYFLNSGDTLVSIHTLQSIFDNNNYSAPFINGNQINDFGTSSSIVKSLNRPLTLFDFYWGTIKHQATFIRRNLFSQYGLYDENLKIVSDWKFFFETIGLHNEQPLFIDIDIVNFEWNGLSTSPNYENQHQAERQLVLDQYLSKSIQADYNHFGELANYEFVMQQMKCNSLIDKTIRALVKLFK